MKTELEQMLSDCLPGGYYCDPQKVADDMREWLAKHGSELERENAALHKDKERLDFLSTLTGSGWACLHLDQKGSNDDWFLTRKQIDRRMATEPKQ